MPNFANRVYKLFWSTQAPPLVLYIFWDDHRNKAARKMQSKTAQYSKYFMALGSSATTLRCS